MGYFADMLLRPSPSAAGAPTAAAPAPDTTGAATGGSPARPAADAETCAEVTRIVARGIARGGLTDEDRSYLAQLVGKRTGLSQDEAKQRVVTVETQAKEAADKTARAGSYFSFWTFMSLLFGAVAATLGGIVGGELRDNDTLGRRAAAIS